ncbi:hypothetical protein ACIRPQ_35205, partial [Streptomyces sp. NPDC101213]
MTRVRGFAAADRAYIKLHPQDFHRPLHALGFMPVLDLTKDQAGFEGHHQGAIAKAGRLFCPRTPRPLLLAAVRGLL